MTSILDIAAMLTQKDAIQREFLDAARRHCPVRTGATRDSLQVKVDVASDGGVVFAMWGSPIVEFILGGTAAHDIYPRQAGALHWQDGSGDHFAAHVRHPGTRPNNFFQPVMDEMRPLLTQQGNAALQAARDALVGRFR